VYTHIDASVIVSEKRARRRTTGTTGWSASPQSLGRWATSSGSDFQVVTKRKSCLVTESQNHRITESQNG